MVVAVWSMPLPARRRTAFTVTRRTVVMPKWKAGTTGAETVTASEFFVFVIVTTAALFTLTEILAAVLIWKLLMMTNWLTLKHMTVALVVVATMLDMTCADPMKMSMLTLRKVSIGRMS
eukprot:6187933-Pleurochrysis_carterae.AAC.1